MPLASELVVGAGTPGFVGGLDAVLGYSFRDRLPEIEVPTLIVWGRNDILIPVEDAYEFERLIGANARAEVFDDTGHLAMLERPVALQRAAGRVHRGTGTGGLAGVRDRALGGAARPAPRTWPGRRGDRRLRRLVAREALLRSPRR